MSAYEPVSPQTNDVEILGSFDVKQLLGIKLNPCLNGSPELVYEFPHCGVGAPPRVTFESFFEDLLSSLFT